jgi:hypothetical protein
MKKPLKKLLNIFRDLSLKSVWQMKKNKDLSHEKIKNYSKRTLKHVESSLIGSWVVSKEEIEEIYRRALF